METSFVLDSDSKNNFVAAVLWVATELTRTPMHADDQMQFLVQLQGQRLALDISFWDTIYMQIAINCVPEKAPI